MLVRVIIYSAVILTIVTGFDVDEDDEDRFGTANEATYLRGDDFYRKRRSQEEGFYHTLLSRSEPQHVFKRSGGTEDFESHSKAMFVTERDWTGSSKISDADRKELEALFSKLNADDGPTKRSIPDEDEDVTSMSAIDRAAYRYAAWLMAQPSHQFAHALTEKAHVDNRLTRLFFEKRGLDLVLPNSEPLTNEKRSAVKTHPASSAAVVVNSTAKHLIMSGPRLCTDDSAKCLCTRACYPINIASVNPCQCAGKATPQSTVTQRSVVNTTTKDAATKQTVVAPSKNLAATFPPQAPAAAKAEVTSFPPQAPAVVKAPTLINAKQSSTQVASAQLHNGTVASSAPVAAAVNKIPATTNATVKSDVTTAATPPLLAAGKPAVVKAEHLSSVEPAVSKSIEPIRSTRYFKGGVPPPPQPAVTDAGARQLPSNESVGLFGSIKPIYIDHPSYQGCYKDRKPVRDLPKRYTRFDTTPESCIMECKYQNYKFAGVQYGYLCFCGNAFGRYGKVSDKDCNSFCNGDSKRKCGAFWHNSVYSVDGRHYDPGIFDYAKVDEEERIHDELSPAPQKVEKKSTTKIDAHVNSQGANAATHLMDAAQATLKAAKKLLPGVSKKHKIGKDGSKRGKRADDEDDAELMYERDQALNSLKSAHQILQKTNFEKVRRSAEKEKRSISEDFDPYDPDDGKDLLKAYMSSVDAYRRQTRSVDDDEEDDADTAGKDNFIYRRMSESDLQEGMFVDKLEDNNVEVVDPNADSYLTKRSAEKDVDTSETTDHAKESDKEKRETGEEKEVTEKVNAAPVKRDIGGGDEPIEQKKVEPIVNVQHDEEKRSTSENTETKISQSNTPEGKEEVRLKRRNVPELHGSGGGEMKKKRSVEEHVRNVHIQGSGAGDKKKRSAEGNIQKIRSGSGAGYKKKRSIGDTIQKIHAGSGDWKKKKRSVVETIQRLHAGSGGGFKRKRSIAGVQKIHSSSGDGMKRRRSIAEPVQLFHRQGAYMNKKRRSLVADSDIEEIRSSIGESSRPQRIYPVFNADNAANMKARRDVSSSKERKKVIKRRASIEEDEIGKKRELKGSDARRTAKKREQKPDAADAPWDKKRQSVTHADKKHLSRSRREVTANNLSDGALKMAARSNDINDVEKGLKGLESIEKKDKIQEEKGKDEDEAEESEDSEESGNGESEDAEEEISGDENKKLSEDSTKDGDQKRMVKKRSTEAAPARKSTSVSKKSGTSTKEKEADATEESAAEVDTKLKSDVERGVDSLLNLVVELYKQQKTIKNFENSVRTLRHDILRELKIPSKDKHLATKKVRNAIQSAAKERLHTLTSSIEHKITEFAKRHPDSVKQAKLATSLLPKIPLNDEKLAEQKREISRRAAEFDNIEDAWSATQPVPDILKEHFKRNAEVDVEDDFETKMKRNAEKDNENISTTDEKRGTMKRNSEEDVEYEPRPSVKRDDVHVTKRSVVGEAAKVQQATEINGEKTLSRMHRDVSESEEEGLFDDDEDDENYEKLFN